MPAGIPIWLTVALAVLTGAFAIAAQVASALLAQRAQARLHSQQRRTVEADRLRERAEEIYGLVFQHFNLVHRAVAAFREYKGGVRPQEAVDELIDAESKLDLLRMMTLLDLYFPQLQEHVRRVNQSLGECRAILMEWKRTREDVSVRLSESFDEGRKRYLALREAMAELLKGELA